MPQAQTAKPALAGITPDAHRRDHAGGAGTPPPAASGSPKRALDTARSASTLTPGSGVHWSWSHSTPWRRDGRLGSVMPASPTNSNSDAMSSRQGQRRHPSSGRRCGWLAAAARTRPHPLDRLARLRTARIGIDADRRAAGVVAVKAVAVVGVETSVCATAGDDAKLGRGERHPPRRCWQRRWAMPSPVT